ncbi:hydroxyneurosporene-O-methyltransferase [Nocardiopsis sp. Huas11]|uniref:methyltransferase n=1 Tax=Nocardiopsis sp. Huas11 TaxID=2183912 RepID=UPI000EB1998F|nr:methyltransferase [Nocardiopsis sp. Huas11]RKS08327.1 hydroxyneurosporene-O-methyltransferase [Nocardiopsis sp. Huas11]
MTEDENAGRELIRLMTGPWAARSVAAAVRLGVVDHLAEGAADTAELAESLGLRADRLNRLLRLLSAVDVVRTRSGRHELTDTGAALHRKHPSRLRDLVLLYDSAMFAQAWGSLEESVRTGRTAFEVAHGTDVFSYLSDHPEDAGLYSAGMAAGGRFGTALPAVYDFTGARVVADLGGGDGDLLATVLDHAPHLHGVLVERPTALPAARERLSAYLESGRATIEAGDFLESVPPGADVHILSRVLHNWSDDRARAVLRHSREALAPGGRVLILERILPDDGSPLLSSLFDVHMLVMTTGAERTEHQYETLLREAGLTTERVADLSLEMRLLVAAPLPG